MAQLRSKSDDVKSFGKMMAEDHQELDDKLVEYASKHQIEPTGMKGSEAGAGAEAKPTSEGGTGKGQGAAAGAMDPEAKKMLQQLRTLKGPQFDRQYVMAMVQGHEKALTLVSTARERSTNEDFKSLLGDVQGELQKHLDHAKELQGKLSGQAGAPSERPSSQGRRPPPPQP